MLGLVTGNMNFINVTCFSIRLNNNLQTILQLYLLPIYNTMKQLEASHPLKNKHCLSSLSKKTFT